MNTEHPALGEAEKSLLSARAQTHIAQAFVALFGAATVLLSVDLKLWVSFGPGPGFFPFVMGILLVLMAAFWVFEAHRRGYEVAESVSRRRVLSTVGSLLVLAILMDWIGFQLSMAMFLFFHLKIIGGQKWIMSIVVTVLGSFGAFALFNNLLGVRLPTASLWFLQGMGL